MPRRSSKRKGGPAAERPQSSKKDKPETSNNNCKALPELFTVPPRQIKGKKKPGQLTAKQIKQYFEEGFLPLPNFFQPEELDPVRKAVEGEVEILANKLFDGGKIKDKYEDADFFDRLTLIEKEFPGASVLMHKTGRLPEAFQNLWVHDRLLNVMEQLVGPDIAGHPVWNLRCKTPYNEQATVPWHQDNAYLDESAQEVLQATAWIPLLDVNEHNGCLQVVPGGHRKGALAKHTCCVGGTWYVEVSEEEMKETLGVDAKKATTCSLPYGGVLLMNNLIPHRSLENKSDRIRWSLDLRYQRPDKSPGFHGLKDSILFRTSDDPNYQIQWDVFNNVDRHSDAKHSYAIKVKGEDTSWHAEEESAFDTTITGPWMTRWEMVHHNRHTDNLEDTKKTWTKA